jgi:MFS family permease
MTVATLVTATGAENRKAVVAGTIGNVLEWYDFGVYGYLATTMSQLFFPGEDKTISLLKAFAVFGVGFVMRPVGSVVFGIYGDRLGQTLGPERGLSLLLRPRPWSANLDRASCAVCAISPKGRAHGYAFGRPRLSCDQCAGGARRP